MKGMTSFLTVIGVWILSQGLVVAYWMPENFSALSASLQLLKVGAGRGSCNFF